MRSLAKTLIAGTLLGTASLCAAATSAQEPVWGSAVNRQSQAGPVRSEATLETVDPDGFDVAAGATGNVYDAGVESMSVEVDSAQFVDGDVSASTDVAITGSAGSGAVNTSAFGNVGTATAYGGSLRGTVDQYVEGGRTVVADSRVYQGPTGATGDVGVTTTAVANSQDYGVSDGWSETRTRQYNGASVQADTSADVAAVTGSGAFVATAVGNNVQSVVDMGSGYTAVDQTQAGGYVVGATFVNSAWGQQVVAASTASANNTVVSNAYGPMEVDARQDSAAYVRSQTELTVDQYGTATASAAGVGNAIIASSLGNETVFTASQTAIGGVDAFASFDGGDGYDSLVQATAHGNSIAASACAECVSTFEASSTQVNNDEVGAYARTAVTGYGRSATVNAGAVGNSASYYVRRGY